MYDHAVLLSYNNNGQIDLRIREDVLVYILGKVFMRYKLFMENERKPFSFRIAKLLQAKRGLRVAGHGRPGMLAFAG